MLIVSHNSNLNYKTELCRHYEETGECRYKIKCQFAHGENELRPIYRHPKYKTQICINFFLIGLCNYGIRCQYIHQQVED